MNREQLHAAGKAQAGVFFDMAHHTADQVENCINLNLSVYKEIMNELAECCDSAWDIQDYNAALQWQNGVFRPFLDRALQYNTRLLGVTSGSAREISRAFENRWHHLHNHWSVPAWDTGAWPWLRSDAVSLNAMQDAAQAMMSLWSAMNMPTTASPRTKSQDLHALHNHRGNHKAHARTH